MESKYEIVTTTTLILNQAEALWLRGLCMSTKPPPVTMIHGVTQGGEPKEEAIIRADFLYALNHVAKGGERWDGEQR